MSPKAEKILELPGLRVSVDRVVYQPDAETPPDRPHCFAYFISIHNHTEQPITIKGRKWVVVDETGDVTVVEGAGVVGQCPLLEPGDAFSYHSYHLLAARSAFAEGSYLGLDSSGHAVLVRIPRFEMRVAN